MRGPRFGARPLVLMGSHFFTTEALLFGRYDFLRAYGYTRAVNSVFTGDSRKQIDSVRFCSPYIDKEAEKKTPSRMRRLGYSRCNSRDEWCHNTSLRCRTLSKTG